MRPKLLDILCVCLPIHFETNKNHKSFTSNAVGFYSLVISLFRYKSKLHFIIVGRNGRKTSQSHITSTIVISHCMELCAAHKHTDTSSNSPHRNRALSNNSSQPHTDNTNVSLIQCDGISKVRRKKIT